MTYLNKLLFIIFACSSSLAFSGDIHYSPKSASEEEAGAFKDQFSTLVMSMEGVNGIGVGTCEESSGIPFWKLPDPESAIDTKLFVNCLEIYTSTLDAEKALKKLLPHGSKLKFQKKDVFIYVSFIGEVRIGSGF